LQWRRRDGTVIRPATVLLNMSRLQIHLCGLAAVLGTMFGVAMGSPARAEPVGLVCTPNYIGLTVYYLSIDADAGTIAYWGSGQTRSEAFTAAATVTDGQVTWTTSGGGLVQKYTLDRDTGALNLVMTLKRRTSTHSWICEKASRVF
jgi:hypothetical protein